MAADVYGAIASYFQTIHDDIICPAVAPIGKDRAQKSNLVPLRPDKLAAFQRLLIKTHWKARLLFDPVERRCVTNDDCAQDEECIKGECVPIPQGTRSLRKCRTNDECAQDEECIGGECKTISSAAGSGRMCRTNDECAQDEECIGGVCTPIPFGLVFDEVSGTVTPPYGEDVRVALVTYWGRIYAIIEAGLAADRSKLTAVRNLLTQTYADAARVAGKKLAACDEHGNCSADTECVNGFCVPIPFRLVFKRQAPWPEKPKKN